MTEVTGPSKTGPWTESAVRVLRERYLMRVGDRVVETPEQMCWRVALAIARAELSWGKSQQEVEAVAARYRDAMESQLFLPNSPTLMNAGKENGLQYSACYVLPVEDSLDGIFEAIKRAALVHKSGGGCIAGDARVWTTFCGIEPIEVLVNRATADGRPGERHGSGTAYDVRDLGIRTLSMDPATGETGLRGVSHVWRFEVPADRQVVVTMREGTVVQTSDWHPFMVLRGTRFQEVPASDLAAGDVVLGPDRPEGYWPWDEPRALGSLTVDPVLGWLIGFTLGDGSFGYVPALRQHRVRWFSGRPDVLERVRSVLAGLGIHVSLQRDARGLLSVTTLNQRFVHDLLEACGLEKLGPKDDLIRVPEVIAKSPLPVVRAFLAGLLDSDGYVAPDGSPSFTTASEAMAQDVAALAGLLGYRPTVTAKEPHGKGRRAIYTVQLCTLPQVNDLARDLDPYQANGLHRERLRSDGRKETALRLPFREWRHRLVDLGLAKTRGDRSPGAGPCAAELSRWSANAAGRCRRDDLVAIASRAEDRDPELAALLRRVAARGQEVKRVERARVPKSYCDLTVEGWNTYAAGRSGLAMVHNTGFAFSRLRSKDSVVESTGGKASGPVSFMRVFDAATEAVKQGGTRRGANMGILRIDHPDILEFIECKLAGGITNFNISVAITDGYMRALEADGEYDLVAPESNEAVGRLRAREVFERIVRAAWRTGDPGLVFIDRVNAGPANPTPTVGQVEATNPCVTGDTLIYTDRGLLRGREAWEDQAELAVAVGGSGCPDRFLPAGRVFRTGVKPVLRLTTKEGYELRLTADHRVRTDRGWVPAAELREGDRIHLLDRKGGFGGGGSRDLGLVLGWLVGDGTLASERAILSFFGPEKTELAPVFAGLVEAEVEGMQKLHRSYRVGAQPVRGRDEVRVRSARLLRLAEEHGLRLGDKHRVPESVLAGSEEMQRGFLQALFTADGHVSGTLEKGASVRLTSINRDLLLDVQRLLLNFGVASVLYSERRAEGMRSLPDGKGGRQAYHCRAYHELIVAKDNLARFAGEIGFLTEAKQQALLARLAAYRRGPYREEFKATFEGLVPEGEEEVFDLTEPVTHSFVANGLVVHNCGEQPLLPNEACNLGSINLCRFTRAAPSPSTNGHGGLDPRLDWGELERVVRLGVRFLDDVIEVNPYPLPDIDAMVKANRRIGLGVMGWSDLLIELGIPYDTEEALALGDQVMGFIQRVGREESAELAKERGPFPNWSVSIYRGGPPLRNATITTIAPTGTISIIAGATSGIEPLFAIAFRHIVGERHLDFVNPHFERVARERGFYSDALLDKVARQGTLHGLAEVPEDVRRVFVTAHEVAPEWHVRMQATFQRYTDNGVSKCIAAGTLVPTSRGLLRIEDFAPTEQEDSFTVLDYDIEVDGHKVVSHYRAGLKPATRITLDNGASLTGATESHRVLTTEGWKRLADLRVGDLVIGKFVESHGPGGAAIPWESAYRTNARAVPIPARMTPALAELLGMLIADGHTTESTGLVGLTHKDDSVEREFLRLVEEVFGVRATVAEDKRNGVRTAYITSRNLVRFIEQLIGKGAYNKLVPDAILQGSREEKLAFLKGVSLDGYVTERGLCVFGGMSEQGTYHVAEICRSFGLPKVYQGIKDVPGRGTYHYVVVSAELQRLIQCVEERKNVEPVAASHKVLIGSGVAAATHVSVGHPAYLALKAIRREGRSYCHSATAARLAWPTDTPVYRVVDVAEAGLVDMYDIEVAESHAYVVNGLVSHNTVNLPNSATVEDVANAYLLAYQEGCIGTTVFRDGCKDTQVLHVGSAEKPALAAGKEAGAATLAVAPAALAPVQAVPPREKIKQRPRLMRGATYRAETPLGTAFITVNENGDNEPFEVFLNVGKAGSDISSVAEAIGRLMSLTLRLPSSLTPTERVREMVGQMTGIGGGRSLGFGPGRVRSLPDAIAQVLAEHIGMLAPESAPSEAQPSLPGMEEYVPKVGDLCPECGHATLVYEEGCQKCYSCGFSEC